MFASPNEVTVKASDGRAARSNSWQRLPVVRHWWDDCEVAGRSRAPMISGAPASHRTPRYREVDRATLDVASNRQSNPASEETPQGGASRSLGGFCCQAIARGAWIVTCDPSATNA